MYKALKLKGETNEDLQMMAAFLQDAILCVGDIAHVPSKRRFAMMLNRYLWEEEFKHGEMPPRRVRTGFHFDHVLDAKAQNIPQDKPRQALDLLTIECEENANAPSVVTIWFAGGAALRLTVDFVEAYMRDVGRPWKAKRKPRHPVAGDSR